MLAERNDHVDDARARGCPWSAALVGRGMKTTKHRTLLTLALAAGAAALTAGAPGQAATVAGAPSGPTPTDVCAQQLGSAPVVGQLPAVNGTCASTAAVNNLVHHPLG